jgi:Protein of unknown function (DUF2723)
MNFQRINIITGWVIWAISTIVFIMTLEPTMPFWDCGEFIASAYKLEVGHPPGAPLFMLIARMFTAFVSPENVPYMINLISGLSSSFTILFLFWTVTHLAKKLADLDGGDFSKGKLIAVIGSGILGSLAYSFSDTFWFSGVEAEVYAMSSLFTAVVFWAILKWESVVDEGGELRWIVLIAYLMGLSIGVHLLNLLAIPAICLVYYFKKYEFSWKGVVITGVLSLFFLWIINSGVIIYFVKLAGWFERTAVNGMGMPFNTGAIFYLILITSLLAFGLWYTHKTNRVAINTLILGITVAILGYTSFATIIVRSQANPPMDENNPENLFALLSYLNREQYGDRPLVFGQYFNTPQDMEEPYKDGADVWVKSFSVREPKKNKLALSCRSLFEAEKYVQEHPDQGYAIVEEYIESGEKKGSIPNYDKRFCGYFPRMHSSQGNHVPDYKLWSNYQNWNTPNGKTKVESAEENVTRYEQGINYAYRTGKVPQGFTEKDINSMVRTLDRLYAKAMPSSSEEIRYLTSYQVGWMYLRYFMWNFVGRQNDKQGHGAFNEGNWISGVEAIDEERVGNRDALPEIEKDNKGLNTYYFLPLILGLIGIVFQLLRHPKDFSVVTLLFLLTGMAIVVYLNQTPQQPRERDYAYAGSFYAFTIWIGLSIYALYYAANNMTFKSLGTLAAMCIGGSLVIYAVESVASNSHTLGYSLIYMSIVTTALFAIATLLNQFAKGDTVMKGIVCAALALPVPMLLLAQNWDDHDRSGRATGVAMANNYLQSLAPNAIIFTNGDNDTFPLWYAQEVEGIRTDVRVVNLSLLNTDWYIDQMKSKAYDSDPVPFKMAEQKYRQGTRDVMFLDPYEKSKDYVPVKIALDTLLDDKKYIDNGRNKINYLGTYKFSMDVPAEVTEKYRGMMHEGDSLVTNMKWAIADARGKGKSYITKAQMMVLDLLANMDWSRPVYFAVTTGGDAYMGLERYFQLEGLAYRLTPILHKQSDNPNLDGGIGTDIMYDNMMNKFKWGNMDTHDIYMDENNRRMTTNLRLQFNHLAEQLITEGRNEEALKVLYKELEAMPEKNVPYEQPQIMWQVADLLYQAGDSAKALELSKRLHKLNMDQVDFYDSVDKDRQGDIERDVITALQISDRLQMMASEYAPEDADVQAMKNEVTTRMEAFGLEPYDVQVQRREQQMQMRKMQEDSMRRKASQPVMLNDKGLQVKPK